MREFNFLTHFFFLAILCPTFLRAMNGGGAESQQDLLIAAEKGDVQLFEKLVGNNTINSPGEDGRTPLLLAAEFNYAELGMRLVGSGAEVNVQSVCGDSPLHLAVRNNNLVFAKFLYEKGAKCECKNKRLDTPLQIAVGLKLLDIAAFFVAQKNSGINEKDIYARMPLHWAVLNGDLDMVKLLVEHGAVLDCGDMNGDTPLHLAAHVTNGGAAIAKYLLSKGALVGISNKRGDTPLHAAAGWNNVWVVRALILAGADVTAQNTYKQTPLHEAILYKYRGTVPFMQLQNQTDQDGCQLGYWADEDKKHLDIVSMLVKKNPKITIIVDGEGNTPSRLAIKHGLPGLVAYLTLAADPSALPSSEAILVADGNELWGVKDEQVGALTNTKGKSALWWAVEKGDLELVKFFTKNGLTPQFVQSELLHAQKSKQSTIAAYLGFVSDYLLLVQQKMLFSQFAKKHLASSDEEKVQQVESDISELACCFPENKSMLDQLRLWNKGNKYIFSDPRLKGVEWIFLSFAAAATSFNQKLGWLEYCFSEFKPKKSGSVEKKFCNELKKYVFYLNKTLPVTADKKNGFISRDKTRSKALEDMCELYMSTNMLCYEVKVYEQSIKNNLNLKQ